MAARVNDHSTCVVLQPSYIPWRGYFHQIHEADTFVFYDDVQYDRRGWRNRNRVKGPQGSQWLTIPVKAKGSITDHLPINEIRIDHSQPWARRHWETLSRFYKKTEFFPDYAPLLAPLYEEPGDSLSDFTIELAVRIARELLGIKHTRFERSSQLDIQGTQTGRLVSICRTMGATRYLSGPAARDYLEEEQFADAGIALEYMTYEYPEYEQRFPPFDPNVSVLDLLFVAGPDAPKFIWDVDPP